MTSQNISSLAGKLAGDSNATLTPDEKQLMLAALSSLAVSQGVIARQARLLKSYQHDVDSIDHAAETSLTQFIAKAHAPPASTSYDLITARAAREALLAEVQRAESLESSLMHILNFAATIAKIAV